MAIGIETEHVTPPTTNHNEGRLHKAFYRVRKFLGLEQQQNKEGESGVSSDKSEVDLFENDKDGVVGVAGYTQNEVRQIREWAAQARERNAGVYTPEPRVSPQRPGRSRTDEDKGGSVKVDRKQTNDWITRQTRQGGRG